MEKEEVSQELVKFLSVVGISQPKTIFLPLCGQAQDITDLVSMGHKVVGVERTRLVIDELKKSKQLNLEFNSKKSIHHSSSGDVVIYIGDLLKCPIENWGPVDIVWDRAAFSMMDHARRHRYVQLLKRSLNKSSTARILMRVLTYDKIFDEGPPHPIEESDVEELFDDWAEIELLDTTRQKTFPGIRKTLVGKEIYAKTYLFTPRKIRKYTTTRRNSAIV